MPSQNRTSLLIVAGLILLAALSRLLPHWPNFTPVGAMALFGAAAFSRKWLVWAVPFVALYLSDLALNNLVYAEYYQGFYWGANPWVYAGFALTILLGLGLLRGRQFNWLRIGGTSLAGTAVFFVLTNVGAWLGSPFYPQTGAGLLAAFAAGLPFLLNSVAGNLFFAGVLFGSARALAPRSVLAPESL